METASVTRFGKILPLDNPHSFRTKFFDRFGEKLGPETSPLKSVYLNLPKNGLSNITNWLGQFTLAMCG
jgi:hypothetical protein